jgi:hypothetical protein
VDPSRIENLNGKKVAYFTYEDMFKAMKDNGVDDPADLRNMTVIATNDNITTYEICLVGGEPVITCKVNGADYSIDTRLPADPTYTDMEFLGWYTTKDYQEGTEYTGGELTEDITVYAKFRLTLNLAAMEEARQEQRDPKPGEESSEAESVKEESSEADSSKEEESSENEAVTDIGTADFEEHEADAAQTEKASGLKPVMIAVIVVIIVIIAAVVVAMRKKKAAK